MIVKFSKKFYNLKAIEKSIKTYQGLGSFHLKKDKDDIMVEITDIDNNFKNVLKDEFCNYVLSELRNN
jgi:hypothetical protein